MKLLNNMNKDRFIKFQSSVENTWIKRMTWNGLYNNESWSTINVTKFLKEVKPFEGTTFSNINDFWKFINNIKIDYVKWCQDIEGLDDKEIEALQKFFIGCIGEYFFVTLFKEQNTLFINNKLYRFDYVCPRLDDEKDYGVDLTGVVSNSTENKSYKCALQVKFWNPFNKDFEMTYDILSRVFTDAILNDFIDKNENGNIFVCWLNDDKNVSKALRQSPIWDHIIFIGKKELNDNINGKFPEFWNILIENLNNI